MILARRSATTYDHEIIYKGEREEEGDPETKFKGDDTDFDSPHNSVHTVIAARLNLGRAFF